MEKLNKKLTILVSTCDSYKDLWEPFYQCLTKYVLLNCDVVFVSESLKFNKFKTITPGFLPWGERNLIALESIETDYILWLLEDYFYIEPLRQIDVLKYLKFIIENDIDRLQISPDWHNEDIYSFINKKNQLPLFKYSKVESSIPYSVSLQPSIWKKEYILQILKKDYSPWDLEVKGSILNKSEKVFIDSSITQHPYFNAVRKKNILNLSSIIKKIDKVIELVFYDKKPFKYSKGLNSLIEHEKLKM